MKVGDFVYESNFNFYTYVLEVDIRRVRLLHLNNSSLYNKGEIIWHYQTNFKVIPPTKKLRKLLQDLILTTI